MGFSLIVKRPCYISILRSLDFLNLLHSSTSLHCFRPLSNHYMMRGSSLPVSSILNIVILLFSLPIVRAAEDTCYWPNKDPAPGFTPCGNSSTNARACCGKGEPCLSNGLCFSPAIGVVYRGACSDSTWPDPACPNLFFTSTQKLA